ncbi:MAG: FtsQ-type POTRA domain-containing protein [Eggerthellaceae bacterium]|nr:FtsQ-type POTRA domain-containing protein [Eggerthellaceae bacterium]
MVRRRDTHDSQTGRMVRVSSRRIGDIRAEEAGRKPGGYDPASREARMTKSYRIYMLRILIVASIVVALIAGGVGLYYSQAFEIKEVRVEGVEHLTADEFNALFSVEAGTTLLRADLNVLKAAILRTAWVESVNVVREFPSTLVIKVKERSIAAIVEVPYTDDPTLFVNWAIAKDGLWLMPISNRDSETGRNTAAIIFDEADAALHISDVPYGTYAEENTYCNNQNVNNALAIVASLSTDLSRMIQTVSASDSQSTTLMLNNGVEVSFGKAENVREKELVVLELLRKYPSKISYINVRVVDKPTYRSVD